MRCRFLTILAVLLVGFSALADTWARPKDSIQFPKLHSKHHKKIGKGTFKDISFGGNNILWMIDDAYLWRWNFLTNSLKKIDLSKGKSLNLQELEKVGEELIVFAPNVFYLIDIKTLKIKRVKNPSHGIQGPIKRGVSSLYWSDRASAWRFNLENRVFSRIAALAGIHKNDLVYHSPTSRKTFIARKNLVIVSEKKSKKRTQKIIQKTNTKIIHMYVDAVENVFFVSKDAVIRVSSTGKVIQAIPALNDHIETAVLSDNFHAYVLGNSRNIELYDLSKRDKHVVEMQKDLKIDQIAVKPNFIGGLVRSTPVIYYLDRL